MSEPCIPCPCRCRPGGVTCGEDLHGIEQKWGLCIGCHDDSGHWQPGDDDPIDFTAIFAAADEYDAIYRSEQGEQPTAETL